MSDIERDNSSSPETDNLDELIADTTSLIASVYDILEQPRRTPTAIATPLLGRRSHNNSDSSGQLGSNSSSPKSPKTPRLCPTSRKTFSTPSSREIDREINRIDRFCEMLEHNLRSVAVEQGELIARRLDPASPNSPSRSALNGSPRNTPQHAAEQISDLNRSPTPEVEVVDLSDSMNMPAPIRTSNQLNMSDDVIIVTPIEDEIVDLCTPTFRRSNIGFRSNYYNRRSPNSDFNAVDINGCGIRQRWDDTPVTSDTPTSRRLLPSLSPYMSAQMPNHASSSRCSVSSPNSTTNTATVRNLSNSQKRNSLSGAPGAHCGNSVATTDKGRTPFMCAVCMESCINNQPTSTKCGHVFCANCIRRAIQLTHKCPMCNKKLSPNMLFRIYV